MRSILAVTAEADGALHVPFHGDVSIGCRYSAFGELASNKAHHDLRSANHRNRPGRPQPRTLEYRSDDAYVPLPLQIAYIDGDQNLGIRLTCPRLQLLAIQQLLRVARAIEDRQPAIAIAIVQNFINGWTKRRQSNSSGNDDHIAAACSLHRPAGSERTTNADVRTLGLLH